MSKTRLFAVTGRPVAHSRSPLIFRRLFEAMSIDAVYVRLAAESGAEALASARAMDISGLNVTSPFKEEMVRSLDRLDASASRLGAANCVVQSGGRFNGFNTDGAGAVGALEARGVAIEGREAVVVGAGGAARAAAWGLGQSGAARVTIVNRTAEKAEAAAAAAGCHWAATEELDELLRWADILVSCVPLGKPVERLGRLKKGAVVLDADYRDREFLKEAARLGCRTADGLDWLIGQALPSFRLMTGADAGPGTAAAAIDRTELSAPTVTKADLALIGLPGAGKTAIGAELAALLGWDLVDTDAGIEAASGLSVADFFKRFGEARFRAEERAFIARAVPGAERTVFSLGGGSILDAENLAAVSGNCTVVWLWVSPAAAVGRINVSTRPLLRDVDPERAASALAESRTAAYARASDLVINTETGDVESLARRIAHEMGRTV